MKKFFWVTAFVVACGVSPWVAAVESTNRAVLDGAFLTRLVDEAAERHPGLRAAGLRHRAAGRAVAGVRVWDDPMFKVGGVVASGMGPDLEMEGDLLFEVEQKLPVFGKARAMRREAEAEEGVASASKEYQDQILRRAVVQAALQLALSERIVELGREDLALVERMVGFARERQGAALDTSLDLLRLENERERRQQALETETLQRDFDRTSLNLLLGRPAESGWPVLVAPPLAPKIPLTEELIALGVRNEPKLRVMRQETARASAGIEVTRRSRLPDLTAGIEGRQWSGSGDFREGMFSVGLNLPWFNRSRYRADLDRDQATADATRAEAEDYEREVRRELFRVWTRIDAARREAELYHDRILPRAELAVSTAMSGWATGRTMFLEVMEARRMLSEARLMHARALNEQHQMITELVTCCGVGDLESLEMLGVKVGTPEK